MLRIVGYSIDPGGFSHASFSKYEDIDVLLPIIQRLQI